MTVYCERVLPSAPPVGRLVVTAAVVDETLAALRRRRGHGGRHEGMVFWAGRPMGADTWILAALVPRVRSTPGSVRADEREVGRAARSARAFGLAVLCQVHSHPGDDVRHSEGDDELVLMPFEGMWSIVVARYGDVDREAVASGMGVHQFRDGRWTWVTPARDALVVVPGAIST